MKNEFRGFNSRIWLKAKISEEDETILKYLKCHAKEQQRHHKKKL